MAGAGSIFPRLYNTTLPDGSADPSAVSRLQDNVSSVLTPLATAVQKTPIMGAAPPPWILATLLNSWIVAPGFVVPAFHKDALGYVHVKGIAQNNSGGASTATIFQLPAGYRPAEINITVVYGNSGAPEYVAIWPDGQVIPSSTANLQYKYLLFSFLAEQ